MMETIETAILKQVGKYKQLTADEQRNLAQRAQRGDQEARDQLVLCNLRLVIATMKHFPQFLAANFDDLYQAGVAGLLAAIDHYDASFGAKFSSYATHWINQSIKLWLFEQNTVYAPRYLHDASIKVCQTMRTGCHNAHELAAQTALEPSCVERAMQYLALTYISIDEPVQEAYDAGLSWSEVVADDYDLELDIESKEQAKAMRAEVKRLLAVLTPRERSIVALRFGLAGHDEMIHSAIGKQLGIPTRTVNHVFLSAMRKLRRAAARQKEAKAS